MKKRLWNSTFLVTLLAISLTFGLSGCGKRTEGPPVRTEISDAGISSQDDAADVLESYQETSGSYSGEVQQAIEDDITGTIEELGESEGLQDTKDLLAADELQQTEEEAPDKGGGEAIDRDGSYTSKEDVALYLHVYGELPQNFMTKKQAKKLGWSGGSLEDYAPGMCIGGDYFGNYEGLLPKDREYHECDIDTLGKKSRGAKRIIYSDDGYIYYTGDHYENFELLYSP